MDESERPHSLFFPLLLVTAGVLFLMANLGYMDNTVWGIIAVYWPVLFIIGGLDNLYQRGSWAGALVGIGLGTVLLLGYLHYLQWGSLDLLLRLWPILLVAWGIDLAFGRGKSAWNTVARVGLGLLLVAGIVWLAMVSPMGSGVKTQMYAQSLDGATSSNLKFSVAAGDMTISGGAGQKDLVRGTIGLPREMSLQPQYEKPVDGESSLSLEGAGIVLIPVGTTAPWNLKVNSVIPMDVTSRMAMGNLVVDLSDVKAKDIDSELAIGRTVLTVPGSGSASGKAQVAIGELVIRVPKGTHVVLHTSLGAVTKQLPAGYTQNDSVIESASKGDDVVTLNVAIGIGSLVVQEIP